MLKDLGNVSNIKHRTHTEYPLMSVSKDKNYTLLLSPRKPSMKYKFMYMRENIPYFSIKKKNSLAWSLNDMILLNMLDEHEYYNPSTHEIKEQPSITLLNALTNKRVVQYYNSFDTALQEYQILFDVHKMINVPNIRLNKFGKIEIKSKKWYNKLYEWFISLLKNYMGSSSVDKIIIKNNHK